MAEPSGTEGGKRRRWPAFLGLAAILLVALVLALPTLASGPIGRAIASGFDERFRGRLEIGELSLSWFSAQKLTDARILDPDGAVVARVSAEVPSCWTLVRSGGKQLGPVRLQLSADLIADDAGRTNLERALEPRGPVAEEPAEDADVEVAFEASGYELDVELAVARMTWSDARTRALGAPFELVDGLVTVRGGPGKPLTASVRARSTGDATASIEADAELRGPIGAHATWPLGACTARARIAGLATGLVEALAGLDGELSELVGPQLALKLDLEARSGEDVDFGAEISGERGEARVSGKLEERELRGRDGALVRAEFAPPERLIAQHVAPYLPPGMALRFEPRDDERWRFKVSRARFPVPGAGADVSAVAREAEFELDLTLPGRFLLGRFQPTAVQPLAKALVVEDLRFEAGAAPGKPLEASLDAKLAGAHPGRIALDVTCADAFAALAEKRVPAVDGKVAVEDLDLEAIGELAQDDGALVRALGPRLTANVVAKGASASGGDVRVSIEAERAEAELALALRDGVLKLGPEPARVRLTGDLAPLAREISAKLPEGLALEIGAGAAAISIEELELPFDPAKPVPPLPELLARVRARAEASLPPIVLTGPRAPRERDLARIEGVKVALALPAEGLASARAEGRIGGGTIALDVAALDPLSTLLRADAPPLRASAKLAGENLPVALVDALAQQDGLVVDALGPRATLVAESRELTLDGGAFSARFSSDLHELRCKGRVSADAVSIEEVDGLLARVSLGPLVSKRVVGALVPLLVDVEKSKDAEPLRIAVDKLVYPLSGGLAGLDADVRIALGEVSYRFLPKLEGLGSLGSARAIQLPEFTIPIRHGVARYEKLLLPVGGKPIAFRGEVRLVDGHFELAADVPLSVLGKRVDAQLDKVREFLPPDTSVPIVLSGTWDKPRLALGKDFVDRALKTALDAAAQKGVNKLLDGLLGPKKKDG